MHSSANDCRRERPEKKRPAVAGRRCETRVAGEPASIRPQVEDRLQHRSEDHVVAVVVAPIAVAATVTVLVAALEALAEVVVVFALVDVVAVVAIVRVDVGEVVAVVVAPAVVTVGFAGAVTLLVPLADGLAQEI